MKQEYSDLCKRLGVAELTEELLEQAFTHVSAVYEQNLAAHRSNERLEYLGDAVLELCVSETLYQRFPSATEGELTLIRSQLVCRENLALVAQRLDLGDLLIFGRGERKAGGAQKPALLADALEALFGVIFLEQGFAVAGEVARKLLLEHQDLAELPARSTHQWKSQLQEIVQREGPRDIVYKTSQSGSDHQPIFTATLLVDGVIYGQGSGRTKQEAEQTAAKEAVTKLTINN